MRGKRRNHPVAKEFIRFLRRNHCLRSFRRDLRRRNRRDISSYCEFLCSIGKGHLFVNLAFSWGNSEKGYRYWDRISDQWQGEYTNIKFKYQHGKEEQ